MQAVLQLQDKQSICLGTRHKAAEDLGSPGGLASFTQVCLALFAAQQCHFGL